MSNLFAIPAYDEVLFERIHEAPTYLPQHENEESIRGILTVAGVITIVNFLLLIIAKSFTSKDSKKEAASKAAWKASYQLTNLLVNLTLGLLGIYYELTTSHDDDSITNKIIGYHSIRYFAIIQIGYQLWALPIGILFVGEQTSMIIHHIAVICVASVSCFLSCGFRYFTPYFYGVIEISSVPLSVMNAFKNNPEWIKKYPSAYSNVRLVFCFAFLLVRVVLWTPFFWSFIVLAMMLLRSSEGSTKIILGVFNASAIVLSLLQYFWAMKIIEGLVKVFKKKGGKKVD